ncbi:hypothetical protein B0A52_08237 [Exophiala mesophila]|uniref:Uncharacterized protein n=1 Tax=Exophiala mesophila TaxID=212818 RepID=A0A438MWF9_EXOME|nr:hypothetical protein B0A52_08237 [Exophiala mesophila]
MGPKLYIAVFKGDPVDLQSTRHTALFIGEDNQAKGDLLHVNGSAGIFAFERRQDVNPAASRTFLKKIPVEPLRKTPTKAQLIDAIKGTNINNTTRSWNCHTSVGDALQRVLGNKWISAQSKSQAFHEMADIIVQAEDEES